VIASPAASIRAGLADRPISPEYLTDRLGANLDAMLAQYAVVNEEAVVRLASHLSNEEAATLPCAGVNCLGRSNGLSPSYRRRHRLDAGFGRRIGLCAVIRPALGRPGNRWHVELRNEVVSRTSARASVWGAVAVFWARSIARSLCRLPWIGWQAIRCHDAYVRRCRLRSDRMQFLAAPPSTPYRSARRAWGYP